MAPEIVGRDMDNRPMKLSEFRGKVVLIDFWGFWCPHCVGMIPHETQMVARSDPNKFVLVGVNSDPIRNEQMRSMFRQRARQSKVNWRSWSDGQGGPIARQFMVEGWPTLFVIDANGVIRAKFIGAETPEVLEKAVNDALRPR